MADRDTAAAFKALRTELRWWFGCLAVLLLAVAAKLFGIV